MRAFRLLPVFLSLLTSTTLHASAVRPGEAAPPLELTKLLQAPAGTKVDWPSLRGKVVVLEFWATWCGPCIANPPHFNQLVAAADPHKVVFLAIDDEDPKVVEAFLTKRRVSGWVGLDPTSSVFHRFGIESRPATVVVDLFGVGLTPAEPNEQFTMSQGKDKMLITGATPERLLQYVYGVNGERIVLKTSLPAQTYDLRAQMPGQLRCRILPTPDCRPLRDGVGCAAENDESERLRFESHC